MAEVLDLTVPIVVPSITSYRVVRLTFDWEAAVISIGLRGPNGEFRDFAYNGEIATTLMIALNKANLSTQSLQRRVLARLVNDGLLAGTISGSPD